MKKLTEERKVARVATLGNSLAQLELKIAQNPDHPRLADYLARVEEYKQSLANIEKHGAETLS